MSKARITISPDLHDIMPPKYQDLVRHATYGKEDRGWKDIGTSKELIEQHSLCAGCPESMAFRYVLASLPNPEDTVMVGSTGCTSLVFPHVAIHNIHSLFDNQNAVASGLKRALAVRLPHCAKDVVVLAGDGATVDIGLDMTLQAWFRQEKFTTICFDNELYANTGGQESGMTTRGAVLKMAPLGKKFEKMDMVGMATIAGCSCITTVVPNNPRRVENCIKKAVLIAREVGATYIQAYTSCNIEYAIPTDQVMEDAKTVENDRYKFAEYVSEDTKAYLAGRYGYKEFIQKPAAAAVTPP